MIDSLQKILDFIEHADHLSADEKSILLKSVKDTDNELAIAAFKLARTEKVKRTTAILLEETIEELEQKRKIVEAQSREASIEVSLERVRSRAMGMRHSDELGELIGAVFTELTRLDLTLTRSVIWILDTETMSGTWWMANSEDPEHPVRCFIPYHEHEPYLAILEKWKTRELKYVYVVEGDTKKKWDEFLFTETGVKDLPEIVKAGMGAPEKILLTISFNNFGAINVASLEPLPDEQVEIILRFAKVFDLTYTRFLDLQKAEAQAREAKIEAALEKVRSRSLAMHTTKELGEVVLLVMEKLRQLGVTIDETGVLLCTYFNNSKDVLHWVATPDLSVVGSYLLPYFDHPIFRDTWESKERGDEYFSKAYDIQVKNKFFEHAFEHSDYRLFPEELKQWVLANDQHILSAAWQKNSAVIIPSHTGIIPTEDDKAILIRFSRVFEQAYVRFMDLQKAEAYAVQAEQDLVEIKAARMKAEQALSELKATQTQLIQSEKMASLGELTAGVAHEIQNPLNFVNNFSDVNAELIEELEEEINNGNLEEVKAIAKNIKENEQKINHHGKRADAIVKGMLQHSRGSNGVKEPTDLNLLADEYLRLTYHGLRAKQKSFNATLKTDFDVAVGKINIVPQDIGRVILNLLTNAFYAVNERKEQEPGFDPIVSVSTKKAKEFTELTVSDNGFGISQAILDKVFQPFFTTKPTGMGTGLGLSLSYDIITKGHGGQLKVNTEEGDGTRFTIELPH
jgi:signal transduction histidine kinase